MIKEEKVKFTAKWCKYSSYKLEFKDDEIYILPDENSTPSTYDAFEISNEILRDILLIGKEVMENEIVKISTSSITYEVLSKKKHFQDLVLGFVNKYGVLGMFRYWPDSYAFIDNPKLSVNRCGSFLSAKEFWQKYFCFEPSINWDKKLPLNIDFTRLCGFDESFKQTEGDRLEDFIFTRTYAETVSEILRFADLLYDKKQLIYTFYEESDEEFKELYANGIRTGRIENVKMEYVFEDGKIKFGWKFFSLAAIIQTMLLLNETNGRTEVKLCKYCGTPFIATNIKSEYDTPQCRNKANISRSRNKNKLS